MRALLAGIVAASALALAGCGEANEEPAVAAEPKPRPTVQKVSDETMCDLLVGSDNSPLERAVDFGLKEDLAYVDGTAALELADEIDGLAERAEEPMAGKVTAFAAALREFGDHIKSGSGSFDMTDFKAAGLEVANACN